MNRKVVIIDSLAASSGYGLFAGMVADYKNEGHTVEEVAEYAENLKANDIGNLSAGQKENIANIILDRLAIVNPHAREDTKDEIERFLGDWKCMAAQSKPLVYYVGNKYLEKYNRLMNYYSEDCSRTEKGTLNSMREVEASATLYYWTED